MIIFIQINVLLILTYVLFQLGMKLSAFTSINSSPKVFLRCVQLLILLSLITPPLVKLMPAKQVSINIPTFSNVEASQNIIVKNTKSKINTLIETTPEDVQHFEQSLKFDFKSTFFLLWSLGFLFFAIRLGVNYFRLKKILNQSILLKKYSKVKIAVVDDGIVPFSVRMLQTYWVVLPVSLLNDKKDLQLAIKHEIQHHRQGDTSWAIAIELLLCVFYFNPVVYLWKNTIIEFQEFSCDEALTGQEGVLSHDYGSCLLRVAETALKNRQMYAGTTCMAVVFKDSKYFKTFLLRRIEMIVKEKKSTTKWIPVCTGLVIGMLTIAVAYGVEKVSREKKSAINSGTVVVDNDVQKIADEALDKALRETKFASGFVIVSDPSTGKILAVANADTTKVRKGHWALSQLVEQASIAKAFLVSQALEKNVTTETEMHKCENGKYKYNGKTYTDWKKGGWKELSTGDTLAISSNICSIKIGEQLGKASLEDMIENFGFGEEGTAKDFPEARVGDAPDTGAQFIPKMALGYAYRSSPIEIMQAFGAIANGGNLMKPIMANSQSPEVIRRVMSAENSGKMRKLLQEVVISGTGKKATSSSYTMAGKTASARFNSSGKVGDERANFAGFVGFAPVNNPRVQVFVGLIDQEKSKKTVNGGAQAAPVFKEVAENVLTHMKVAPDRI